MIDELFEHIDSQDIVTEGKYGDFINKVNHKLFPKHSAIKDKIAQDEARLKELKSQPKYEKPKSVPFTEDDLKLLKPFLYKVKKSLDKFISANRLNISSCTTKDIDQQLDNINTYDVVKTPNGNRKYIELSEFAIGPNNMDEDKYEKTSDILFSDFNGPHDDPMIGDVRFPSEIEDVFLTINRYTHDMWWDLRVFVK